MFLPNIKRLHGAAAATGMRPVAISPSLDGKSVEWMEQVSAEEFRE